MGRARRQRTASSPERGVPEAEAGRVHRRLVPGADVRSTRNGRQQPDSGKTKIEANCAQRPTGCRAARSWLGHHPNLEHQAIPQAPDRVEAEVERLLSAPYARPPVRPTAASMTLAARPSDSYSPRRPPGTLLHQGGVLKARVTVPSRRRTSRVGVSRFNGTMTCPVKRARRSGSRR